MSLLTLFLPQGSPFEPDPGIPDIEITLPVDPEAEDVPYFDVLTRIQITDGTFDSTLARREDARVAYTEKVENTYVLPVSSGAVAVNFGGIALAKLVYIETSSTDNLVYFKLNGGTEYNVLDGCLLFQGNTIAITSLTIENKSTLVPVTARVVLLG